MLKSLSIAVLGVALATTACGNKEKPASTTTTKIESTTETDNGVKQKTETTEVTTQAKDGSETVQKSQSSEVTTPPPPPVKK